MSDALRDRAFHRQMYVDLMRAYLPEYGTQRDLARALGVKNPMITYWLRPLTQPGGHWSDVVGLPPDVIRREIGQLRTPSTQYAKSIAACLCTDAERGEALLYHIEGARQSWPDRDLSAATIAADELTRALQTLGSLHTGALLTGDPETTRVGYAESWRAGLELLPWIDRTTHPLEHAQVLMFLNDAASVLDKPDLALRYARETLVILAAMPKDRRREARDLRYTNALLAEVVSLNNLRLFNDAVGIAAYAMEGPAGEIEPWNWRRSFLDQRVKARGSLPRFRVRDIESDAHQAHEYAADDPRLTIGTDSYVAAAYLAYHRAWGTKAILARATFLIERLLSRAQGMTDLVPLRRVRLLRVAAAVYDAGGDLERRDDMLRRCFTLIDRAGLAHQRSELIRKYGSGVPPE